MLISFAVENFRSIKTSKTFSMITSPYKELANFVRPITKNLSLLPVAAIYGANSSGKSNLLRAMNSMRRIILTSVRLNSSDSIYSDPFALAEDFFQKPTTFEAKFFLNKKIYRYGFTYNAKEIKKEWLFETVRIKEQLLFCRSQQELKLGKNFKEGEGKIELTAENRLFLSLVSQLNGEISKQIIDWFQSFNNITGIDNEQFRDFSIKVLLKNDETAIAARKFLNMMDLGFSDLKPSEQNLDESFFPNDMPAKLKENILKQHANEKIFFLESKHKIRNIDGSTREQFFSVDDMESEGTLKMLDLSGPITDTLHKGSTLVIDELDAKLHPLLTQKIILLFNSPTTNPNNAQLIFATHDVNLLRNDILRRDQIWFAEKDSEDESTNIRQLSNISEDGKKIRNDRIYEKDYINGEYGAIPKTKEF